MDEIIAEILAGVAGSVADGMDLIAGEVVTMALG